MTRFSIRLGQTAALLLISLAAIEPCFCQADDVLTLARQSPPSTWNDLMRVQFEKAIEWRITQIKSVHDELLKSRDRIRKDLKELTAEIESDEAALPRELRYLNLDGRSQLASHLVQSLFDTKLDLAVTEATIARVEEMETERDVESIQRKELELQAARTEFESAVEGAALAERLGSSGASTSKDVGRSKTAAELARLKMQICENALQAELMKQDRNKAEQLTQLRLQQKPLQAKLETLDGFMEIMQVSSAQLRTIEQKRQERELILRDLAWVAGEIGPRSLELLELENLLRLAKERANTSAPAAAQQPAVLQPAAPQLTAPQAADANGKPSDR
jgi:hypothetical protein